MAYTKIAGGTTPADSSDPRTFPAIYNPLVDGVEALESTVAGKADTSHTHAAGDVTSGTFAVALIPNLDVAKITTGSFSVARGGTGRSTLTAGSYLRGNGTTAVDLVAPATVLADIGAAASGHGHSDLTPTARNLTAGDGLSGGGNLTADRSFAVDSTVVRTTGDQSIGGTKTFTGSVAVSAPTADNHVASKQYVDDNSVVTGDVAPTSPSVNDLWVDTSANAVISRDVDAIVDEIVARGVVRNISFETFTQQGPLFAGSGNRKFTFPVNGTIEGWIATVNSPAVGSSLVVRIMLNGIQLDQGEVTAGTTFMSERSTGSQAVVPGDAISVNIVSVGTTEPGEDLVVTVRWNPQIS